MPMKYNNYHEKDDFIANVPITEQISKVSQTTDQMSNMLSNIIAEKQKMNNTSVINMVGALTPVTYYHVVSEMSTGGNLTAQNAGPADIGTDTKKYQKIKNFLIKIESGVDLNQEGEDDDKSYNVNGNMIVLPRTIKPVAGDFFLMEYYNKSYCWFVTGVEVMTFEIDNGFKCTFTSYKREYDVPESQIVATYIYHHEFVGTTYRPVLTPEEYEILTKAGKLYDHLSDVYNSLFYDKIINGYVFKDYDYEKENRHYKDINNINTLGRRGGNFRATHDGEVFNVIGSPVKVLDEAMAYDNYINEFMAKNKIFRNFEGIRLTVEPMLAIDRIGYKRSIYNCIEANTVAYFKNTSVSPVMIPMLQQGLCSYLVGKKNVLYKEPGLKELNPVILPGKTRPKSEFFPQTLADQLVNGKSLDMKTKCTGKVYSSIDNFIIETIVRYVYKKTDDFVDRIKYLYDNMDCLYEHEIKYSNIFYLFPLLGFVLEHSLEKLYADNVDI